MSGGAFDSQTWQDVVLVRRQAWAIVSMPFDDVLHVELDREEAFVAFARFCGCEHVDGFLVCDDCGVSLRTVELAFSANVNDAAKRRWLQRLCTQEHNQ